MRVAAAAHTAMAASDDAVTSILSTLDLPSPELWCLVGPCYVLLLFIVVGDIVLPPLPL